jgi:hypothetical protein
MNNKKLSKNIELQVAPSAEEHPCIYKLPDGTKISVPHVELEFFRQLQRLPAIAKIIMMQLKLEEMEKYVSSRKKELTNKIENLFADTWLDNAFGEPITFEDPSCNEINFGIALTDKEIIKKARSKKLNSEQFNAIVNFFECGENVYRPKDRENE